MTPRRIALIKPSALGDIAHALPVLSALRQLFPSSHLTWVVNKAYEPLVANHPDLDATLPFDRGAFKQGAWAAVRYSQQFLNTLRRQRFDLVLDLQGLLRTGLMCAATGAPRKLGFANAREGAARFYTDRVADARAVHAVDRYWRFIETLGGGHRPKRFHLPVSSLESAAVARELQSLPRPYLVVAVGSRWQTKLWRPEHFAALAGKAQRRFGGSVLFVGTAEDTVASASVARQLPGPHRDLTGKTSLPKLVATLNTADVMIANDTGPLHLAAALGRPCVAPYTCTTVALHGPYGQNGGVETSVACGGSYLKRCPHGMVCMNELTPEKLWRPLEEVLASWADRCRSA